LRRHLVGLPVTGRGAHSGCLCGLPERRLSLGRCGLPERRWGRLSYRCPWRRGCARVGAEVERRTTSGLLGTPKGVICLSRCLPRGGAVPQRVVEAHLSNSVIG
jgi:hypothetical protein